MFKSYLILLVAGYVQAMTDAEAKTEFTKKIMACTKDHPVEISELTNLHKMIVPEKTESKCLLACAYRMNGMMTKDGKYNLEQGYKYAEIIKEGDEKRLENGRKLTEICSKVNNVQVSDGEKGCERAALMFKCVVDNAPKFGFKM